MNSGRNKFDCMASLIIIVWNHTSAVDFYLISHLFLSSFLFFLPFFHSFVRSFILSFVLSFFLSWADYMEESRDKYSHVVLCMTESDGSGLLTASSSDSSSCCNRATFSHDRGPTEAETEANKRIESNQLQLQLMAIISHLINKS